MPEARIPTIAIIYYHTEHGVAPKNGESYEGGTFTEELLPTLVADGYEFLGWYSTSTFEEGTLVQVGESHNGKSHLYAKWSTLTVSSVLTNLADEIRVLSGTTEPLGLTEMATNVNDANDEVTSQTDLIAQVVSALQGKSVPGDGASVETCTVVLNASSLTYRPYCYSYTTVDDNGNITGAAVTNNYVTSVTLNNVVCGSVVTVYWYTLGSTANVSTNATRIALSNKYFNVFQITASAGGTAYIVNSNDTSGGGN